ncbi:MAG: RnfABCDGE type electron transport complex subunit D, partial [Alistipes inops]
MEKQLRKIVDKYKPAFSKGGKFGFLHSTFDAFETFLFVPNTVTRRGSHIRDANDLKRTMIIVIIALLPALLFGMYNVGYQHFAAIADPVSQAMWFKCWWYGFVRMLPMILVSYIVGLGIEFAVAQHKGEEVNEGFLVTGLLIPMIM